MSGMTTCPKCGSSEIVPRARIIDRGDYNAAGQLQVGIEKKPEAWVFKQLVQSELYATICASCGFTEIYASNPRAIYDAYQAARQEQA
jgi:predicted nucleic-acid-binding Zn-ribbon protein